MTRITVLAFFVATLGLTAASAGDCSGDPGYTLAVPDLVGIGEKFDLCCGAPGGSQVYLLASLGQGPIGTPYGDLCLDFPPLIIFPFVMPGSGTVCFSPFLPCDRTALGLTLYVQFIALGPPNGRSNQDSLTIVDNGRCP